MKLSTTFTLIFISVACIGIDSMQIYGQAYIYDDFEDGNIRDHSPFSWRNDWGGEISADTGKLQLAGNGIHIASTQVAHHQGWSMQTRASHQNGDVVGLGISLVTGSNVWMALYPDGILRLGTPGVALDSEPVDFESDDVMLRFDAIDDNLSAWAWRPGEPMPEQPLISSEAAVVSGRPGVWMEGPGTAEYMFFEAATMPLTELARGDFNADGELNIDDLEQLTMAIQPMQNSVSPRFDVNDDGSLDELDRSHWVTGLRGTWIGDANLDGEFNSSDLVSVFTAGEYEDEAIGNSNWATGDWNGDGEFTSADFVAAFQDGGFEQGPRAAYAVPEPSGFSLLVVCAMMIFLLRYESTRAM